MYKFIFLIIGIILVQITDSEAQRRATTYESLLQRTDNPASYIDHIALPASDSTGQFAVYFRLDYDLIPFLRKRQDMNAPTPDSEYFAPVRMGLEIFEGPVRTSRRSSSAQPVFRESWQDTIWVNSFEETKSRFDHVQSYISANLEPGDYHYELQLTRGGSINEQSSSRRNFTIEKPDDIEKAKFTLLSDVNITDNAVEATLLNYGNNVLYGQNYELLIQLPQRFENSDTYTVNLYQIPAGGDDESSGELQYSVTLNESHLIQFNDVNFTRNNESISLIANVLENGINYALLAIPNNEFENSRFRIELVKEGVAEPMGERLISSQWLDMPVSLYNLDVAIQMLKFIVNDQELRRLNSGSTSEKEKKFREFWTQRDPTPDTEFNELMTEYYRRIDFAHTNFKSMQQPGYETDQGRAYILYGPPDDIERRLPTNAPTREIWSYPNRTLVFEATTGFGDFRLISES
tara:strand:+ start:11946 stop:13334 length:1389 start_codon:yes stop_codon:yes gene_type:complete